MSMKWNFYSYSDSWPPQNYNHKGAKHSKPKTGGKTSVLSPCWTIIIPPFGYRDGGSKSLKVSCLFSSGSQLVNGGAGQKSSQFRIPVAAESHSILYHQGPPCNNASEEYSVWLYSCVLGLHIDCCWHLVLWSKVPFSFGENLCSDVERIC